MSSPNPNKQPVELNRTSLYIGLCFSICVLAIFVQATSLIRFFFKPVILFTNFIFNNNTRDE